MARQKNRAAHSSEAIEKGVRKFHKRHNRAPVSREGDATFYIGYSTNWNAVNSWLRNHDYGTLPQFCKEKGFLKKPRHTPRSLKKAFYAFFEETGRAPSDKDGDATLYVGIHTTWALVGNWLSLNGHTGLRAFARKTGVHQAAIDFKLEIIKKGIVQFHAERGCTPRPYIYGTSDAAPYVGYPTNWTAVNSWLFHNGFRGIVPLCTNMRIYDHPTDKTSRICVEIAEALCRG